MSNTDILEKKEKELTKEKSELLDPGSKTSSMRWAILKLVPVIMYILAIIPILIGYQIYMNIEPDWSGIATFIGSLGVFMATILGPKAMQKKYE